MKTTRPHANSQLSYFAVCEIAWGGASAKRRIVRALKFAASGEDDYRHFSAGSIEE